MSTVHPLAFCRTSSWHPRGVGVVVVAEHTCTSLRSARAHGARPVTSVVFGSLREDPAQRVEFLAPTPGGAARR